MRKLELTAYVALAITILAACAPYHQDKAQSAMAQGRVEDAADEIQAALSNDPNNLQLKHMAAHLYQTRGEGV